MTARVFQKPAHVTSTGADNPSRTYHYGVKGTVNESTARSLVAAELGPVISTPFGILFRGDIRCDQIHFDQWDVDIDYLSRPADIGSYTWSGDGTGQTTHITHSLETIAKYPTATAPSFGGAIGYDGKEIQGTDIIVPFGKLSITFNHPAGVMTLAYWKYLKSLAGYVNSANFFNWAAGEVRFLGPICSDGSQTDAQAIYNFEISDNQSNLTVGTVTGITKAGWHVAWVKYKDATDTVSGTVHPVRIAEFVYVERVSPTVDFRTAFGFG